MLHIRAAIAYLTASTLLAMVLDYIEKVFDLFKYFDVPS